MNDEWKNYASLGTVSLGPMSICSDAIKTMIYERIKPRSVLIYPVGRKVTEEYGVWRRTTGVAH